MACLEWTHTSYMVSKSRNNIMRANLIFDSTCHIACLGSIWKFHMTKVFDFHICLLYGMPGFIPNIPYARVKSWFACRMACLKWNHTCHMVNKSPQSTCHFACMECLEWNHTCHMASGFIFQICSPYGMCGFILDMPYGKDSIILGLFVVWHVKNEPIHAIW